MTMKTLTQCIMGYNVGKCSQQLYTSFTVPYGYEAAHDTGNQNCRPNGSAPSLLPYTGHRRGEPRSTGMGFNYRLLKLTCRPLPFDPWKLQRPRLPLGVLPQLLMICSCFSARSARSSSSSMNCCRRTLALASRAAVSCRNWSIWATSLQGGGRKDVSYTLHCGLLLRVVCGDVKELVHFGQPP